MTHIEFEEVLLLLGGDLVVRSEGQVVDFNALPQVHPLQKADRHQCDVLINPQPHSLDVTISPVTSLAICEIVSSSQHIKLHGHSCFIT